MAPEYIAIIVTISVLGGVIVIALVAVCVAKYTANRKLKRKGTETQLYGDMVALHNANGQQSFVRYPAPEPYTPVPYESQENPWRFSRQQENNGNTVDVPDRIMLSDLPGPHNMSRRPSHVQDPPRRLSYAQDPIPRRSSYAQDLPRRSSHVQDPIPRRSSYAHAMPRRPSNAPDMLRRPSRRPSLNPTAEEPPSGQQNKLWYNYLKEDPKYYTKEVMEWNKQRPRVWPAEGSKTSQSPPPRYEDSQRHHQAASHSSWM